MGKPIPWFSLVWTIFGFHLRNRRNDEPVSGERQGMSKAHDPDHLAGSVVPLPASRLRNIQTPLELCRHSVLEAAYAHSACLSELLRVKVCLELLKLLVPLYRHRFPQTRVVTEHNDDSILTAGRYQEQVMGCDRHLPSQHNSGTIGNDGGRAVGVTVSTKTQNRKRSN